MKPLGLGSILSRAKRFFVVPAIDGRMAIRIAGEKAERYKATHALTRQEIAVLDAAIVNEVWRLADKRRLFDVALEEVERFRAARARMGSRPVLDVAFLPETEWPQAWRGEQRLSLLFEPKIEEWTGYTTITSDIFRLHSPRELAFARDISDFPLVPADPSANRLWHIEFYRRKEPFLWKGSELDISESDGALELKGGAFSSHTPVGARGTLAAQTFEFLKDNLESRKASRPENESLWLALGFPFAGAVVPRPRPVQREERLLDPVRIKPDVRRLWILLARVPTDRFGRALARPEALAQWMAVE